jgi:D-alanyl-lipoteichoic acid acyltransferase DltB (MBOAT superfamily)
LRWRSQNVLLLISSYFFYGWWDWRFLTLILISTVVDYQCARFISRSDNLIHRRFLLSVSIIVNLTFLGFFKYFDFFIDSTSRALAFLGLPVSPTVLGILLPPGISFYTFQELAYIVDVYQKKLKPSESLIDYALFISLFPHLIAGPIQRPSHLLPQVQNPRTFDSRRFFDGLMLIVTGLFRKTVIADQCALLANAAFSGKLGDPSLPVTMIGIYAFAWQIYGDFSGYSDIARGSAQLLGFHFMVNFRQPYLSRSVQEFWQRWHISLSSWLRDYLYIPLGGNRQGEAKTYRNLMSTMLLGGLWHGANWTFVIWGGIHGIWLSLERIGRALIGKSGKQVVEDRGLCSVRGWMQRFFIFHLICFTWVFFRAASAGQAFHYLSGLSHFEWRPEYLTASKFLLVFTLPLFLLDLRSEAKDEEYAFERAPEIIRFGFACVLCILIALFSANAISAFIYFQF